MNASSHQKVAKAAYQLWKKAGCPKGQTLDFWFDAEKAVNPVEGIRRPDAADRPENEFGEKVQEMLEEFGVQPGPRSATSL